MTDPRPQPDGTPAPRVTEAEASAALRTALRDMVVLLAALLVVGVVVGYLVAGLPGVWGALLGVALALVFSGTTVVSVMRTTGEGPARTTAVIVGAWLVKMVFVFAALLVLGRMDFYDRTVLGLVLLAGVIGSAVLDLRAVQRARVPYVEPTPDGGPEGR
jgi:hypothetical protein